MDESFESLRLCIGRQYTPHYQLTPLPPSQPTDLPQGWSARFAPDGRVLYLNHWQQKTQWEHPVTGHQSRRPSNLPIAATPTAESGVPILPQQHNRSLSEPPTAVSSSMLDNPCLVCHGVCYSHSLCSGIFHALHSKCCLFVTWAI